MFLPEVAAAGLARVGPRLVIVGAPSIIGAHDMSSVAEDPVIITVVIANEALVFCRGVLILQARMGSSGGQLCCVVIFGDVIVVIVVVLEIA